MMPARGSSPSRAHGGEWRAPDRSLATTVGVRNRNRRPRLGREFALKLVTPALATAATAKARLIAEARAASALDHPNIATVYDIG
ncbi:MAG TPA: hypothetical protein VMM77_00885, partial [Gemmatimonadaceae bacterium]|nr:hypothetical protein [Gemmatimonadaceae bacterium]